MTVNELIAELQKFPGGDCVKMEACDTGYEIPKIYVRRLASGEVILFGDFDETVAVSIKAVRELGEAAVGVIKDIGRAIDDL